jgi:hypothetical protein
MPLYLYQCLKELIGIDSHGPLALLNQFVKKYFQICHPIQSTHHEEIFIRCAIGLKPFLSLKHMILRGVGRIELHFAALYLNNVCTILQLNI